MNILAERLGDGDIEWIALVKKDEKDGDDIELSRWAQRGEGGFEFQFELKFDE